MQLALLLLADGRHDDAEREFRGLLDRNADDQTLAQAGRALLDAGRYASALPLLDRAGSRLDRAMALFHLSGTNEPLAALAEVPPAEQTADFFLLKARILHEAGRTQEAQQLLGGSWHWDGARPHLIEHAALLLAGYERFQEAARMLARAIDAAPHDRELLLSESIVLALDGRIGEATSRLKRLEERWPEWDGPYRVHTLVLNAAGRTREAARRLGAAAALGYPAVLESCKTLRDWLFPSCRGARP